MVIALRQAMQEGDFAARLRLADHASQPQLAEIFNELMATMDIQDRVWQRDRRLWQATLDAAPVAIWVKDLAGRYVLVNQRAKISLGESCLGQTDSELMSAELSASERQDDRNVLLGQPRLPDVVKRNIKFAVLDADGQPMAVCGVEGDFEDGRVG
ncbi:PAS domain-containing protein [Parachitinimonas caeni]|uniref:PAS domain-containing protein n=1 Tax=Parachitinimonas caeni TaxID=3031301 RepID=A0ABT7DX93_9NEIS|nr:PAS domain-containing protein [Parachitinimonas caeni]MDK2124686.1 PAS domain-containing protein [Parachitinimonas caeni]